MVFFSVPFDFDANENLMRTQLKASGALEHLEPPEYHVNPVGGEKRLCFYHFGWRLLVELRAMGFDEVSAQLFWSREFAYLGGEQMLLLARKRSDL